MDRCPGTLRSIDATRAVATRASGGRCRMIWSGQTVSGQAMKATLNLNDQVLRKAKGRAAREGITLTRFVEDALRARLAGA